MASFPRSGEDFASEIGEKINTSRPPSNQSSFLEINNRPIDSIRKASLLSAWEQLVALVGGQPKLIR
jgi:hypothetical protein